MIDDLALLAIATLKFASNVFTGPKDLLSEKPDGGERRYAITMPAQASAA